MGIWKGTCERCGRAFTFDRRSGLRRFCSRHCSTAFTGEQRARPEAERFDSRVDRSGRGCWLWTGGTSPKGYGIFRLSSGRGTTAHRYAFLTAGGVIEDGQLVCHRCDNPRCVNPEHLFAGTPKENTQDMLAKGRGYGGDSHHLRRDPGRVRGMKNPTRKLTEDDVREIRKLAGVLTHKEIAARFGVGAAAVSHVINRRNWKHVA